LGGDSVEVQVDAEAPAVDHYEHLFKSHYPPVFRLCLRYLRDPGDAEDAVQEVFSRAVRQGSALRGDILPWLATVARRVCLDEIRRRKTNQEALGRTGGDVARGEGTLDPEQVVLSRVFLQEMLSRLTSAERRVVTHTLLEDRSHVESAASMGLSSSTTRVLLSRARRKLHEYLRTDQEVKIGGLVAAAAAWSGLRRKLWASSNGSREAMATVVPAAVLVALVVGGQSHEAMPRDTATAAGRQVATLAGNQPTGAQAAAAAGGAIASGRQAASARLGGSTPVAGPRLLPVPPPQPRFVNATDLQASPDYGADHTVYSVGTVTGCTPPPCYALFESGDGGHSWTSRQALGLTGTQLLLPAGSVAAGRFYAFGQGGLQITTNGGETFTTLAPRAPGFAAPAPGWTGYEAAVSNLSLLGFSGAPTPKLGDSFRAGEAANGAPVFLQAQAAPEILQPVTEAAGVAGASTVVLRCAPSCGPAGTLAWSGATELVPSPAYATDGTVLAYVRGGQVAVSTDGASSFRPVALPPGLVAGDVKLLGTTGGLRVVAWLTEKGLDSPYVSDDLGGTWRRAGGLSGINRALATVASPRRMVVVGTTGPNGDLTTYGCSLDGGGSWGGCPAG
jgi:RNA polymerase sigma-70 factor (ECF subfamily)